MSLNALTTETITKADESQKAMRITRQLVAFWEECKGNRPLPIEDDINPDLLKDVWDDCFLIHTYDIGKGVDYNYTYLGANIMRSFGTNITQGHTPPLASAKAEALAAQYRQVILTGKPMLETGCFIDSLGHEIRYRQCLLPFGVDGTVTAILGGMRYKIFE